MKQGARADLYCRLSEAVGRLSVYLDAVGPSHLISYGLKVPQRSDSNTLRGPLFIS